MGSAPKVTRRGDERSRRRGCDAREALPRIPGRQWLSGRRAGIREDHDGGTHRRAGLRRGQREPGKGGAVTVGDFPTRGPGTLAERDGNARRRVGDRFPAHPASAGKARALVSRACRDWGVPQITDDAELVVTELVENAVRHARTPCDVDVELTGRDLRIEARDGSTAPPRRMFPDLDRTGGRGLMLIDMLCRDWGFDVGQDGKRVWAVLAVGAAADAVSIRGTGSSLADGKQP